MSPSTGTPAQAVFQPLAFQPDPGRVNIPPAAAGPAGRACTYVHTHVHAQASLSHRRDLGMPEPGCCQHHSGQEIKRWQLPSQPVPGLDPLLGWAWVATGQVSGVGGSPYFGPMGCFSPHR